MRYCQTSLIAKFFASALVFIIASMAIGQGLIPTPREDYEKLRAYDPKNVFKGIRDGKPAYGGAPILPLPKKADLSAFLPEPGKQVYNDCVGWAVARGVYSYQIGKVRLRKPKEQYDLFSPSFIYSQINNGEDKGGSIEDAVKLVSTDGCATEATMPYHERVDGWKDKPSREAKCEARNFSSFAHEKALDLEKIKFAISQNLPVVLGIHVDDNFYKLMDDKIYKKWAGVGVGKHGLHAITAVGYDDAKSAVRLMNSWGIRWGDRGYCWVDYKLFSKIAPREWCFEAHVIRIEKENAPRFVRARGRDFLLNTDGSLLEGEEKTWLRAGSARAALGTNVAPYAITLDGGVSTLRMENFREIWSDISADLKKKNEKVAMFAANSVALYILTIAGQLYVREPGEQPRWHLLPMPVREKPIDLRSREGEIYVTTSTGKVFHRNPTANRWEKMP